MMFASAPTSNQKHRSSAPKRHFRRVLQLKRFESVAEAMHKNILALEQQRLHLDRQFLARVEIKAYALDLTDYINSSQY